MSMLLASPLSYLLPSIYLTFLALFAKRYSPPIGIHLGFAIIGLGMNIVLHGFWGGLRSLAMAAVVFLLLVLTGILSGLGTFAISVALVSLPVMAWTAFLPGLIVAIIVSIFGLRKATNNKYLISVVMNTLVATGVMDLLSGQKAKPDLKAIMPLSKDPNDKDPLNKDEKVNKLNLTAYLAVSVILVGVLAIFKY